MQNPLKIIIIIVKDREAQGFPGSSDGKESSCNAGDLVLIAGLGKSTGEGNIYHPLQQSGLENSRDCIVHGVTKVWIQLSGFHFHREAWHAPIHRLQRVRHELVTEQQVCCTFPYKEAIKFFFKLIIFIKIFLQTVTI